MDLIDRQVAIEAVEESRRLNHHQDGKEACAHEYEHRHFLKILRDLPSVQPEQSSEIQDILRYLDTVLHPIISPDHWSVYAELHDMISMLHSAQPEEAIPVAWLEKQAKWFESMDNAFAQIEANNIRVMIKKWRSEKDERSDRETGGD